VRPSRYYFECLLQYKVKADPGLVRNERAPDGSADINKQMKGKAMKSSNIHPSRNTTWCCTMLPALAALLLWAWPATAGEKTEVSVVGTYLALDMGQASQTPSGNMHIKDVVAVVMMISDNPLVTGKLTWTGDINTDALANGGGSGTGVFEVGTWDFSSGAPEFTSSEGLWVTKWEFRGNMFGPYTVKVIAHGVDGEVEGMQYSFTAQGGGGVDNYSGTILDPHAKN
jgi:hypothetical protein